MNRLSFVPVRFNRPLSLTKIPLLSDIPEIRFSQILLFVCLVFQRFAIPLSSGQLKISIATPIMIAYAFWGLYAGWLALDRRRFGYFLFLLSTAILSFGTQFNVPTAIAPRSSLNSLAYWLLVTSFGMLVFTRPNDEDKFYRALMPIFLSIAIAGILQFVLQFAGLSVFSFRDYIPDQFLNEELFAVVNPIEYGSNIIRSNGFFLVEASAFSQFMAVGLIIEFLRFRRPFYLAAMLVGMFVSVSGTGWMILGAFILYYALTAGVRGMKTTILLAMLILVAFVVAGVAYPPIIDRLVDRVGEFGLQGTSGNERFVTPLLAMDFVYTWSAHAFWTGIGPGSSEYLANFAEKYTLNTATKILLEYGVFGLLAYLMYICSAARNRTQRALAGPLLVMLMFAGGNQSFSPVIFSTLLLINISSLSDSDVEHARGRKLSH